MKIKSKTMESTDAGRVHFIVLNKNRFRENQRKLITILQFTFTEREREERKQTSYF